MSRWRNILRRVVIGCVVSLGVFVSLLLLAYGLAQTQAGRDQVAEILAWYLSRRGEREVAITRLNGTLPQYIELSGVKVRDREGEWLSLDSVVIEWRPVELLRRRLHVTRIEASGIRLVRLGPNGDQGTGPSGPGIPTIPVTIAVDRFTLEDVHLGESVAGVKASLRAVGESAVAADGTARTSVGVERTDGTRGRAALGMVFLPRAERLRVQFEIDEAEGGLIARLLSLSGYPPVSVRFTGDGPLTSWHGRLIARAGNLTSIETDVKVSRTQGYSLVAQGRADIARLVDDPIRQMLSEVVSYRFEVDFTDWEMIALRRARLASDVAFLDLAGRLVRDQAELKVDLSLTARGSEMVNDFLAPGTAGRIAVGGTFSGPVLQPEGQLEITVADLSLDEVSARELQGAFSLRPDRPLGTSGLRVQVEGQGRIQGIRHAATPVGALLGEIVEWAIEGQIDAKDKAFDLANFRVSATAGQAVASGRINLADRRGEGNVRVAIDDLGRLGPAIGLRVRGGLALEAQLRSGDFAQGLAATITGEIRGLSVGSPALDALLGHQVFLAGGVTLPPGGGFRADEIDIAGANTRLEGALSFTPEFQKMDGRYILRLQDLAVLSTELRTPLQGSVTLEGRIQGDLAAPSLGGSLSLAELRVGDLAFGSVKGTYKIGSLLEDPQGSISFILVDPPFGPADASTNFVLMGGSRLRLNDLSVSTRETKILGDITIPLEGPAVEGTLSGQVGSLEAWSELLGPRVSGAIAFNARLYAEGIRQAADIGLKGDHLQIPLTQAQTADIGQIAISALIIDLMESPHGRIAVEGQDARVGGTRLSKFELTSDAASIEGAGLRVRAAGDVRGPFDLDMAGRVTREGQILRVTLDRLQAILLKRPLILQQPVQVTYGPGLSELGELVLTVGDGRIAARGRISVRDLSGMLDVQQVPLSLVGVFWPSLGLSGTLDGHARVSGPIDNPSGQFRATLADTRVSAWGNTLRSLSGEVAGDWSDHQLSVHGQMSDGTETTLEVRAKLPLQLAPPSVAFEIPAMEPVSGRLAWRGTLAPVSELLALDNARVSGRADLDLDIGGTIRTPQLRGHLTVSDGEYEHFTTGTLISNIDLEIRVEDNKLTLSRAVGDDGRSGRLNASGMAELDRARHFPMRVRVEFNNAVLVRRDELTAGASGRITLDGSFEQAVLSGQIETDKVEARIPDRSPSEVVELDVVEVNHPNGSPGGKVSQVDREESFIQLDLDLALPKRVFIRGRGLDSEWSGKLRVTGTFHAPIVEGELRPVRGEFSFAGKIFTLGEGSIRFDGSEKIDPTLNLAAKYSVSDFTATIGISGPASRPEIRLTSDPSLPQSEIVSRILFGKTTGQLSALEAAQLAEAVASLTGAGGGGQSVLDVARRTLGVDVFRVSGGAEDTVGPTVTVGKYVADKVFVGVTQGTQPGTGFTTVEVEVTPNVSVESNVGQDGRSNVGVKWKWDY